MKDKIIMLKALKSDDFPLSTYDLVTARKKILQKNITTHKKKKINK